MYILLALTIRKINDFAKYKNPQNVNSEGFGFFVVCYGCLFVGDLVERDTTLNCKYKSGGRMCKAFGPHHPLRHSFPIHLSPLSSML